MPDVKDPRCKTTPAEDEAILTEHARGDTLRTIGERHLISHETVRTVVLREGSRLLANVGRDLVEAQRGDRPWPDILIPWQVESEWRDAMAMFFWLVNRLREHFDIKIVTTQRRDGTLFTLTVPVSEEGP